MGQYITGLEHLPPGRALHYAAGFRLPTQSWDRHSATLASNDPLFARIEVAYAEVIRLNTLLAWRETGAKSVFGVSRQEDDLHAIQERTKEAILALDTFLRGDTIEDDGREVNLHTIRLIKGEIGTGLRLAENAYRRTRDARDS